MPRLFPEFVISIVISGQLTVVHLPLVGVHCVGQLEFWLILAHYRNVGRLCSVLSRCWLRLVSLVNCKEVVEVVKAVPPQLAFL